MTKTLKKGICAVLLAALCAGLCACDVGGAPDGTPPGGQTGSVTERLELRTEYGGGTVDLCAPELREYLSEQEFEAQCAFLLAHSGEDYDGQAISFAWTEDGSESYSVWFADNAEFEDALVVETSDASAYVGLFVPGKTYYWKVEGKTTSATDSFVTLDMPVRFVSVEGIGNVRDIGGWNASDGRRVRYGMLYRGSQLNGYGGVTPLPEEGKRTMRESLGMRAEIDLRLPGIDDADQSENAFDSTAPYLKAPIQPYTCIVEDLSEDDPKHSYFEEGAGSLREIFALLADESNYPVYYHCLSGADRAGTLTYLLNGLLGVSYEDLTRDFEITSFTAIGDRWRGSAESGFTDGVMSDEEGKTYVAWGMMHELFMKYYGEGGSLADAVERYLTSVCGVPSEHIEAFRDIMLEDIVADAR